MMLKQRITKLEQTDAPGCTVYAWADCGETPAAAIARQFPEGLAENLKVFIFRWADRP